VHTDRCGNTHRQKFRAKGRGNKLKYSSLVIEVKTNVEPEMYYYTSYNWSHWNCNEKLKETSGSYIRKTFDRITT
jgi:hypothetical protein